MTNKYQQVHDQLKTAILTGQYAVDEKLPTETQLMQTFRVSRYTIRRAMTELQQQHLVYKVQGGGTFVQDWQKNWQTSADSKLIGVITTHIADYIFPRIISGIDRVLSQAGYSLLIGNTHNTYTKERQSLIKLLDAQVAGLIIEPTQSALPNANLDLYEKIQAKHIPTLFINATYPEISFPSLTMADSAAEEQLVEYLLSLGHRSILGVFKVDDQQGVERMQGFIHAYQKHPQFAYQSNLIMYQSQDELAKILQRIDSSLSLAHAPTAIACYNDELAIQLIDYLRTKHLRVPQDYSVVGFDDYQMSEYLNPALTTVKHEKEQMGEDAGKMLLQLLQKKTVQSVQYHPQLIKRQSVAAITPDRK